MQSLQIVDAFSDAKKQNNLTECFVLLEKYYHLAKLYSNFSSFDLFEVNSIQSPKIMKLWNLISFEKSLFDYDFITLHDSYNALYRLYFESFYKLDDSLWDYIGQLLDRHNPKIFEIYLLKVETTLILEILTSFRYKLDIPRGKNLQKFIEVLLCVKEYPRLLKTLNKYVYLLNDEKIKNAFHNSQPLSRGSKYRDKFLNEIQSIEFKKDIRIDVLIDDILSHEDKEKKNKDKKKKVFNKHPFTFFPLYDKENSHESIHLYIALGNYEQAVYELEKKYQNKKKDTFYYYLKIIIIYRDEGLFRALEYYERNQLEGLVLNDRAFYQLIHNLKFKHKIMSKESNREKD